MGIPVLYTDNPYEDVTYRINANELRVDMGSDVVVTGASVSDDYKIIMDEQGCWLNEYGMKMRQGDIYVEVIEYPLANAETKADIENFQFPDPDAPGRFRDAEALVKKYKNDYLVVQPGVLGHLPKDMKSGLVKSSLFGVPSTNRNSCLMELMTN